MVFLAWPVKTVPSPADLSCSAARNRVRQSWEVQDVDSVRSNFIFAFDKKKRHFIKSKACTHTCAVSSCCHLRFLMQLLVVFIMCVICRLESTPGYPWVYCQHFISKTSSSCLIPIFCLSLLNWPQADGTLYCIRSGVCSKVPFW